MLRSKHYVLLSALVALAVSSATMAARAQTPSLPPPPYNVDIGAVITNALRTAGTVTSATMQNLANRGVLCTLATPVSSGSPSTTFGIQSFDAANGIWQTLATSGALTSGNSASVLVYPGATLTTTPSGWVLNSLPLPRAWRVTQTIGGTGTPAITGKIGCNYLD